LKTKKNSRKPVAKKAVRARVTPKVSSKSKVKLKVKAKARKLTIAKKAVKVQKAKPLSKEMKDRLRKLEEKKRVDMELSARKEACKRELERINKVLAHSYARQAIVNLAGENSLEILKCFEVNLSDEEISRKLSLKISDVRATLNKLHGEGLVIYFRDKNNETGWYSYTWLANANRVETWINNHMESKNLLATGSAGTEHYFCPDCGLNAVHDFEAASNISFKCQLCSADLQYLDAQKRTELVYGKK
jgi:transcription factor E